MLEKFIIMELYDGIVKLTYHVNAFKEKTTMFGALDVIMC